MEVQRLVEVEVGLRRFLVPTLLVPFVVVVLPPSLLRLLLA